MNAFQRFYPLPVFLLSVCSLFFYSSFAQSDNQEEVFSVSETESSDVELLIGINQLIEYDQA
ncbi:MAG: hypothetical protein ACFB15_01490, partial [Cyclobacteriaceae bacterium]